MAFKQSPPALGNQYDDDRVLRSYLKRTLPDEVLKDIEKGIRRMGALAAGPLYALHLAGHGQEPTLTQWNAWGDRLDHVETTPSWKESERIAAEFGLVATAYEQKHGIYSRLHQFALVHLFAPSTDFYAYPLSITDGAARTLLASGSNSLILDAVPHLTSRNLEYFWLSGQWLTEPVGRVEKGRSETIARPNDDGTWRLYGHKTFITAITAQMALVLARPEDNPPGEQGLALFYVELRDDDDRLRDIQIERLVEKLGTRKLPTAEITLNGTSSEPVGALANGVRALAPMRSITQTWHAVCASALMRRGIALARDFAQKRTVAGTPLSQKALHVDTLAGLQATYEGAFHLAFRVTELLGRSEANNFNATRHGENEALLRVLAPLAKLTIARQSVAALSDVIEAFGSMGYVETSGLPTLLRDAQAFTLLDGTTNVLALDVIRALSEIGTGNLDVLRGDVERCREAVNDAMLADAVDYAAHMLSEAGSWFSQSMLRGQTTVEAGARRFALHLGRAMEIALLARHAQWSLDYEQDARAAIATRYLAAGPAALSMPDLEKSLALANDLPLPIAGADIIPEVTLAEVKPHTEWGDGAPLPFS